jgi:hypothetical protein
VIAGLLGGWLFLLELSPFLAKVKHRAALLRAPVVTRLLEARAVNGTHLVRELNLSVQLLSSAHFVGFFSLDLVHVFLNRCSLPFENVLITLQYKVYILAEGFVAECSFVALESSVGLGHRPASVRAVLQSVPSV